MSGSTQVSPQIQSTHGIFALIEPGFSESKKRSNALFWLALAAILIVGAFLRLYQIGSKTIWLDEAFSIWMARQTLPDMLRYALNFDTHPPFYYLLLHLWMQLGYGAAWLRSLSALAGVLTIPAIFLLGRRIAGATVGWLAAVLFSVSALNIYYSQETRMYAQLTLLATLSLWVTVRLLTDRRTAAVPIGQQLAEFFKPGRQAGFEQPFPENSAVQPSAARRWLALEAISTDLTWIGYVLFTGLTWYSQSSSLFLPVAINGFVVGLMIFRKIRPGKSGQFQPPSFSNWFWAQVALFLFVSPWLVAFYFQSRGIDQQFWLTRPSPRTVLTVIKGLLSGEQLPYRGIPLEVIWAAFSSLALLGVFFFRKKLARLVFLVMIFATPIVCMYIISLRRPIFYLRPLVWLTVPAFVLLAAGIAQLRFRPLMLAGLTLLVFSNFSSVQYSYNKLINEDWSGAASYVAQNVQSGDVLVFNASDTQIPFEYYYDSAAHPVEMHGAPADLFDRGLLEPIMTEQDLPHLQQITQGHARVWLIYSHNWFTDPNNLAQQYLANHFALLDQKKLYEVQIFLYEAR